MRRPAVAIAFALSSVAYLATGGGGAFGATPDAAAKSAAPRKVSVDDKKRRGPDPLAVKALFRKMTAGFLLGDAAVIMRLFSPRLNARHRAHFEEALRREFEQVRYTKFEVVELRPDTLLDKQRLEVEAVLRLAYEDRAAAKRGDSRIRRLEQPYIFVVHTSPRGVFLLGSRDFFSQIGKRRSLNPVAWAFLVAVAGLAALAFWVWMGWEVLRLRPRRPFWRAVVLAVPFFGALAFVLVLYLPQRLQRRMS